MASPFDVFRKPHRIAVYGASTIVEGVVTEGQLYHPQDVLLSTQRIGRDTTTILTAQGKRPTDYRRLYGSAWLPKEGEAVINSAQDVPGEDDLLMPSGEVIHFYGKHNFDTSAHQCPAARILIDGWWCAVETRVTMQNSVINNYEYLCYRLPMNEQL